jgi:16S rRNA (guanine966-N2)-methyltransferase
MNGARPGTLRIVGGTKRGRRFKVPARGEVRPTADRVREAIFDALGPVEGLHVLDLFAGSGAMGLEALSRGASRCVFVEGDGEVAAALRENIAGLGFPSASAPVLVTDYVQAARRLGGHEGVGQSDGPFDLLFVDPPYRMLQEVEVTLGPLLPALLADDGVVVVEGPRSAQVDMGLAPTFDRRYGDTRVVMLEKRRNGP